MKVLNRIESIMNEKSSPEKLIKKVDVKKDNEKEKEIKKVNFEEPIQREI